MAAPRLEFPSRLLRGGSRRSWVTLIESLYSVRSTALANLSYRTLDVVLPSFSTHFFSYVRPFQISKSQLAAVVFVLIAVTTLRPVYGSENALASAEERHGPTTVQVQGKLVPVGEQSLGKLEITAFASGDTSSTTTSDGTFSFSVSSNEDILMVKVDAPPSQERTFHPALLRASTGELEAGITVLMIPLKWTIKKGKYAGQVVEMSMYKSFSHSKRSGPAYLGGGIQLANRITRERVFQAHPKYWAPEDRPIPVVLYNVAHDQQEVTPADSASYWSALEEMEDTFGRDLFRPAALDEFESSNPEEDPPVGALTLLIDTPESIVGGRVEERERIWGPTESSSQPWQTAGPKKYRTAGYRIESGKVSLRYTSDFGGSDANTLKHEVLHAMGFGHGCLIEGRMPYSCDLGVQSLRDRGLSRHDVAYWELRNELLQAAKNHDSRYNVLPSLFGERRILRGLKPIPSERAWINVDGHEVENSGTFSFDDTGTTLRFSVIQGRGQVLVRKQEGAPRNPMGMNKRNVGKERLIITGEKYPFASVFDVGENFDVRVDTSTLEGIEDPSNVRMYRRPWTDRASFEKLPTTFDAPSGELVATTSDFGEFAFASDTEPLPVEIANLEATATDGDVRLTWQTASETNNAGFEVQQKAGDNARWKQVGYVESNAENGTTTEAKSYSHTIDNLPAGTHQFRLKQVDLGGSSTLTDPISVDIMMQEAVKLTAPAPNPVSGTATLSFAVKEQAEMTIRLYNTLGQQVATVYEGTPQAGEQQMAQVDVSSMPSGTYFLRLRAGGQTRTQKLTVIR